MSPRPRGLWSALRLPLALLGAAALIAASLFVAASPAQDPAPDPQGPASIVLAPCTTFDGPHLVAIGGCEVPLHLRLDTACCAEHLAEHGFTVTPDPGGALGRLDLTVPPGWLLEPEPDTDVWHVHRVSDRREVGTFQGRLIGVTTGGPAVATTKEG